MRLFQYISGKNEKNQKIAMTTPVHMTNENNKSTMEFVLPSKYSLENIAAPNDKNIEVYNSKPGYYAAINIWRVIPTMKRLKKTILIC